MNLQYNITELSNSKQGQVFVFIFNPSPSEVSFVICPPKGGLLRPPPWIFYTECLIPLYLLPVYRYGPPLSIDTKMSTIELHMTSL